MSDAVSTVPPAPPIGELRRHAFGVAYRMLGSVAEAEDVVQEALVRWLRVARSGEPVDSPKAYLTTVTTRLAIDVLRSARVRRESYFGIWLPEPLVEERQADVALRYERRESLSMAFLLLLETLSPVERAVFLLREAFEMDYGDIAAVVEKSEANCRQLFARAKRRVDERRPRFEPSLAKKDELAGRFFDACAEGDLERLVEMLAHDAAFYGDGGGKVAAATRPVTGAPGIARFLRGLFEKGVLAGVTVRAVVVNGQPGILASDAAGGIVNVMTLDVSDGRVQAVRAVVNPEKLRHLGPPSSLLRLPRDAR